MCGRYSITSSTDILLARFGFELTDGFDYKPSYNVAPTDPVPAVLNQQGRKGKLMKWGLIPYWSKDGKPSFSTINARVETIVTIPTFKEPLRSKRCLVLADGYYEWKGEGKLKTPYRITLKSGEPFAFAGLYDTWKSPTGERVYSCSIITCEPNELTKDIHDRMPAILPQELETLWMDPVTTDPDVLLRWLKPYPAEDMKAYQVSAAVGNVKNNDPSLIVPEQKLF
ncbi:MAG: SOS response-associated peptidase [Dehalococcoidia bacterium]|nr:SOS response-associated peptidase [Dehalococcoidia bacterium]